MEMHQRPIVPVYLNQKLVFDLVAMLQGGISTVTAVTTSAASDHESQQRLSAGFGLSEAFSTLLRIDLSGNKQKSDANHTSAVTSEDRVHTPASLFYKLRTMFVEKGFLTYIEQGKQPAPGEFIEFNARLKRNPIVETLDSFAEMLKLADLFSDEPTPDDKHKNNAKGNRVKKSQNQTFREQMLSLSESLRAGSTIDLTATNLPEGYSGVVTVETAFLNDPSMSDLVDGSFKVFGKVVRSVLSPDESISLLRKAALSKLPKSVLAQAFGALTSLGDQQGFEIPDMVWEVPGPAIQVLPVAVYA